MESNQNNVKKEKTILKFDVKDWYYIKSRGMSVRKKELLKYVDFEPMLYGSKQNLNELVSFFCEIHYPFYLNGMPKTDENLFLEIYLTDYKRFIDIPASIVEDIWYSGWPREGIMGERYSDFPWRLLKPIKEYLDNPTDIDTLISNLYPDDVNLSFMVISIYYDLILPWIKNGKNVRLNDFKKNLWFEGLQKLYDLAIDIHKKEMLNAFSVSSIALPYKGVTVYLERYKNLSEEEKQNPFLIYMLETCIPNQEKLKLKNTKKA